MKTSEQKLRRGFARLLRDLYPPTGRIAASCRVPNKRERLAELELVRAALTAAQQSPSRPEYVS